MARVNKTTGFFLVLGVIVLVGSVSGVRFLNPQPQDPSSLPSDEEMAGGFDVFAPATLDVRTRMSTPAPGVPGRVATIEVKELDRVKAGAVLLRLDNTEAYAAWERAKDLHESAKLKVTEAKLQVAEFKAKIRGQQRVVNAAKEQFDAARVKLDQVEKLNRNLGGKDDEVKLAAHGVQIAQESYLGEKEKLEELEKNVPNVLVEYAEKLVKDSEKEVERGRVLLDKFVVRAPSDGVVLRLNISIGDPVGTPAPNMQPPIWFCPEEPYILRAEVDQDYSDQVREGQQVSIYPFQTRSGEKLTGRVERVSPWVTRKRSMLLEPDQINDARTCEVIIRFDPPPTKELKLGSRARVQIHTK